MGYTVSFLSIVSSVENILTNLFIKRCIKKNNYFTIGCFSHVIPLCVCEYDGAVKAVLDCLSLTHLSHGSSERVGPAGGMGKARGLKNRWDQQKGRRKRTMQLIMFHHCIFLYNHSSSSIYTAHATSQIYTFVFGLKLSFHNFIF